MVGHAPRQNAMSAAAAAQAQARDAVAFCADDVLGRDRGKAWV